MIMEWEKISQCHHMMVLINPCNYNVLLKLQKIKTGFLNRHKRSRDHAWFGAIFLKVLISLHVSLQTPFLWRASLFGSETEIVVQSNVARCIWVGSTWLTKLRQRLHPPRLTPNCLLEHVWPSFVLAVQRWQGLKRYLRCSKGLQLVVDSLGVQSVIRGPGRSTFNSYHFTRLEWTEQYVRK
jgi:hypothetical protein